MVLQATAIDVLGAVRLPNGEPAGRAGDVAMAAEDAAVDEKADADPGTDGDEDRVAASLRRTAPRLAEHAGRAVRVDRHGDVGTDGLLQLVEERVVIPLGNVRRPDAPAFGTIDPGHGDAHGRHRRLLARGGDTLGDQCANIATASSGEQRTPALQQLAIG